MADKVFHPAKPNPPPPFNRPIYRPPQPPPPSSKLRGFFCSAILSVLSLILLAAIAGGIFYAIYRPHSPTFSISSLRLSALNTTSLLDITITARNPNRRIAYHYDQISISVSSNGVGIGEGSFPGFVHSAKNTTVIRSSASTAPDLKKDTVPLEILMETKALIKIGRLKTKKVDVKISCDGIEIAAPKGKKATQALTVDTSCKVKFRMKIWKWTV